MNPAESLPTVGSSRNQQRGSQAWDWRVEALCRQEDPSAFFHPDGERGTARTHRQEAAKRICAACPVMVECRDYALRFAEPFGIWGGLTEEERSRMLPAKAVNLRTHRAYQKVDRR